MNEAVGNTALFNLAIIFVVILIAFFVGSLSYTKAYKVKNKIVEEIEKQGEYAEDPTTAYANAEDEIIKWLDGEGTGYRKNINGTYNNSMCNDSCISDGTCSLANANTNVYQYCVYMFSTCKDKNDKKNCNIHYKVTTYMYFDVPVISELVRIPVSSETMTFRKINS